VWALYRATYKELALQPPVFPLQFTEMPPGAPMSFGAVTVDPFRVPHQEKEISLGLRLTVGGRTILYSGDTGWTEELVARSHGADLFICECSYFDTRVSFHLDYPRLAENHARFGARRMILTHLGREVQARRQAVEIEMASDGLTVDV